MPECGLLPVSSHNASSDRDLPSLSLCHSSIIHIATIVIIIIIEGAESRDTTAGIFSARRNVRIQAIPVQTDLARRGK